MKKPDLIDLLIDVVIIGVVVAVVYAIALIVSSTFGVPVEFPFL